MPAEKRTPVISPLLIAFVVAVFAAGSAIIADSFFRLQSASLDFYAVVLAGLTIASGRLAIKIPGRPATISVSEVFVFASILLFGPAVPVLTVAVDGTWISLTQRDRRWYRALFNIAEPAISTWVAAAVFFAITHTAAGAALSMGAPVVVLATVAMAAAFFALNSGLSAFAVALETGSSPYEFWRGHAWYLAVNYYAAASLAALAVTSGPHINFGAAALVLPLLLLSYVAYREASRRSDEATRHIEDVERQYRASIETLAIAVDAKDQVTHGHIRRVQRHTLAIARALGITDSRELKAIEAGALLHDIGKLAVPDYVLNKPSALTAAEFETMKKHASMGARILTAVEFPFPVVPIVRHHHERWDGRGYPDGLVGDEIPLGARILAVVDCFDALTSDRPYRPRQTDEQAIDLLRSRKGTFYDPGVVEAFVELMPGLREADAHGEPTGAHASVVAGLARTVMPAMTDDARALVAPAVAVPRTIADAIDVHSARQRGSEIALFALNAAQDAVTLAYATPRLRLAVDRLQIPLGSGVSGWVAVNRSTIRQAHAVLDLGPSAAELALTGCVCFPVFNRADLFGVLALYVADKAIGDATVDAAGLLAQEVGLLLARAGESTRAYRPLTPAPSFQIAAVS